MKKYLSEGVRNCQNRVTLIPPVSSTTRLGGFSMPSMVGSRRPVSDHVESTIGKEGCMRRIVRLGRAFLLPVVVLLIASLAGCATPEYRYVGSDDRDLVIKMPRSWAPLDNTAALKASGIDPASSTDTWTAFYDAAAKPVVAHVQSTSTDDPFLFAQSIPIGADRRDSINDDQLRELMLPATPELRANATKTKEYALLVNETVAKPKQHGVHVRYSAKIGTTTEIFDRIALTDTKRTAVHIVFVHCTSTCFAAHPEIDDVVTSLTLKFH
jgi:hypothetical protein